MAALKDKFAIEVSNPELLFKKDPSVDQLARNMYHVYYKLTQMVTDYFTEEWFTLHGSLLPTSNGHNCNLTREEYTLLNHFIKQTL